MTIYVRHLVLLDAYFFTRYVVLVLKTISEYFVIIKIWLDFMYA